MVSGAPVAANEREGFLDILRGVALLGIYIANLQHFSFYDGPKETGGFFYSFDGTVEYLQTVLIEGKFYSIFSLLFGWGLALQMQRLKDRGVEPVLFIKRRLWAMLLLGSLHMLLLWTGDIVAFYALIGFVLLLFRNKSDKALLWWSVGLLLSPILLYFLKMNFLWLNAPAGILRNAGMWIDTNLSGINPNEPWDGVKGTSTWADIWKQNIGGIPFRYAYLFFVSRVSKVLGMFLLGYMIGRNYRYKAILSNRKLLIRLLIGGFLIGIPANMLMAHFASFRGDYFNLKMNGWYQTIFYAVGVAPLAIAYCCTLALAIRSSFFNKFLRVLKPLGKMAFTNYLMQSFIAIIVFYGAGFAKGGQFGPTAWTIFGITAFTFQLFFSTIWLQYFRFGPVEWLWRSMTYRKWQPFKKYKD
jgi:uncharacterized protein